MNECKIHSNKITFLIIHTTHIDSITNQNQHDFVFFMTAKFHKFTKIWIEKKEIDLLLKNS